MRSTYLFLSVAAPLVLAFVIPDESILEIVSETHSAGCEQVSQADVDTSLLEISPDKHRSPGGDGYWHDDDEYSKHGDWPGHGGWGRHGDWPHDDEAPEHGDWPGYDEDPHGRWPGDDERPGYGRRPGHGGWPGHRDDGEGRYRRIDACPGPLCRADKTTWELIKESEHTSHLAELIAGNKDLIEILNSTTANHTFFVLTNRALEGLPRGKHSPSSKLMTSLLRYHILPDRLSIHHIAGHQTLPTKLKEPSLESKLPQRIVVREHRDGVVLNGRSRVVGADMTRTLLHHAPAHFDTFMRALARTKLANSLDPAQRQGGTTFAPTNEAFRRLGEHVNRFLFSERGEGCLRALMQYHIVPNRTLYSDVLYSHNGKAHGLFSGPGNAHEGEGKCVSSPEEDSANLRLVTLLEKDLGVEVKREFGEVDMRVNGFGRVERLDLLASDGVVHGLDRVLIPSRKIQDEVVFEELMIEELVESLDCAYGAHEL